jgi:hypothetical protein
MYVVDGSEKKFLILPEGEFTAVPWSVYFKFFVGPCPCCNSA